VSSETNGATGLAGRYATALFDLAETHNALDQVAGDLNTLAALIDSSDDFTRMIRSPVISRAKQGAALDVILEKMEASDLTRKFAGVVAANRRLFSLPDIIDSYLAILAGRRGEVTAEVTSAEPLSSAQEADLLSALKSAIGTNVSIKTAVDPKVIGGLVVRVGSRLVDSSLQTKLNQLRLAMRGVG